MSKIKILLWGSALLTTAGAVAATAFYRNSGPEWLLPAAITLGTTAYHLLIRIIFGGAVNWVMRNRANPQNSWFRLRSWEPALYRRLRVKVWKEYLPTYVPTLFSFQLHTPEEIAGAMCQAEIVHELGAIASLAPLAAIRWFGSWPVFLITSLASMSLELALVAIQRYNRPRVLRLITRQSLLKK